MNPSHPEPLIRVEISKYTNTGKEYMKLGKKRFDLGDVKLERKSEYGYDG